MVPHEFNYLVNPMHPDFSSISVGEAESLVVDRRLVV